MDVSARAFVRGTAMWVSCYTKVVKMENGVMVV